MSNIKKVDKKASTKAMTSPQYDLFTQFVTNNESLVSNTVEVWESIPKYFFTPQQVKKLRNKTGHADPYKWSYKYNGMDCEVKINLL